MTSIDIPQAAIEVPSDIKSVQEYYNKMKYVPDVDNTKDDWQGLKYFKENGGDCEDFSKAKCANLMLSHKCEVVYGMLDSGVGHAVVLVDGKYWLDSRKTHANSYDKPKDFTEKARQHF